MTQRTYKRRTISLSPMADEGLQVLMKVDTMPKASRVIDQLLRQEMSRRGFTYSEDISQMDISVIVNNYTLPTAVKDGTTYIEAAEDQSYDIRLQNNSSRRRLVVLSVDGINVVDGKNAAYDGKGYVLLPWQTTVVKGWLLDGENAASFTFGGQGKSYAEKTGRGAANVGVIGATVFDEKHLMETWMSGWHMRTEKSWSDRRGVLRGVMPISGPLSGRAETICSTEPMPSTTPAQNFGSSSVGTQFGQKVDMATTKTTFDREGTPALTLTLRYGTAADLERWGVPRPAILFTPNAFPGEKGCSPPGDWRG